MRQILAAIVFGLLLGTSALFMGGALSWSYYSASSASRASAIAFAWPFFVAQAILPTSAGGAVASVGLLINFGFYILVAWLLSRLRRRLLSAA